MQQRWERLLDMWQTDKSNLSLTVELIDSLFAAGEFSQVESLLNTVEERVSNSPEIRAKNIELLFHQNRLPEAQQKADELCQLTQNHPIALHYVGLSRYLNGDLEGVLSLQNQQQLTPETTVLVARALYHKGDIQQALSLVTPINIPEAVGLAAMLYYDSNQLEKANECADKVLAHTDSQMDALLAKASYLVNIQQVEQGHAFINRALQLQPKSGRALSVRGQIEFFATDLDAATATFTEAVQYMPDHIGTWHLLAWCHFLSGRLEQAKEAFEQALALDRNFGESHGGLAVVAAANGDLENAANLAKVALRLNPHSYSGLYASSIIAEKSGKVDEATDIINGIMAQDSHIQGKSNLELVAAVIKKRQNAQ